MKINKIIVATSALSLLFSIESNVYAMHKTTFQKPHINLTPVTNAVFVQPGEAVDISRTLASFDRPAIPAVDDMNDAIAFKLEQPFTNATFALPSLQPRENVPAPRRLSGDREERLTAALLALSMLDSEVKALETSPNSSRSASPVNSTASSLASSAEQQ